jgi:hypothetical protein
VLAFNEESGQVVESRVTNLFVHPNWKAEADTVLINGHLRATTNHPFFLDGRWVKAENLKAWDVLKRVNVSLSGNTAAMGTVPEPIMTLERLEGANTVYNFEVETFHTYFADGILVHNMKMMAN